MSKNIAVFLYLKKYIILTIEADIFYIVAGLPR